MNKREKICVNNCISKCVDKFILEITELYNCDWNCSMSKYLDFVTDKVNKQLKQLRIESSDNYND